ncbi:IS701 family transposase [Noviherbaspirillum pedocola]|uniref:IS701 family transposase n=1 Tax=Noviherbaspirillum pedocola TaxID=2801341 RepID=A0A934SYG3_9BURK|nr:IS701 family transposase [Noviherbaspirillum pedocola]MBK4739171.1 IS701 family transposase [Noviherbaspirillum pedocola]
MDTVIPAGSNWHQDLEQWLAPFLAVLNRSEQRCWAPFYLQGLLGPGARKSVEPMAERVCPGQTQQLHHFVSTSPWPTAPLEQVLRKTADALVGGEDAVLIADDTALPKQGQHSVGVKRQHCGVLGKQANCQVLVSLTLARKEVPIPITLRLYLPEDWAQDPARRAAAKVPESLAFATKGEIALAQIDAALADGVRFGMVLADAGFGSSAAFRAGLTQRGLRWAVGVQPTQKVYPADVQLCVAANPAVGRPAKYPRPSVPSVSVVQMIESLGPKALRRCSWRHGTKGKLSAHFAVVRVRVADGELASHWQHLPGQAAWLVCEARSTGERKYYFTNHPIDTPRRTLIRAIKARWACEQAHQQLKDELGLDHYEGRSWLGLHHHALLTMIAFAYLQHRRLQSASRLGKKIRSQCTGPAAAAVIAGDTARSSRRASSRDLRSMS